MSLYLISFWKVFELVSNPRMQFVLLVLNFVVFNLSLLFLDNFFLQGVNLECNLFPTFSRKRLCFGGNINCRLRLCLSWVRMLLSRNFWRLGDLRVSFS